MLEISKAVQRVAAVERRAAQEAVAAAAAEREQRTKAEKALAAQQQETLQLRALMKVCYPDLAHLQNSPLIMI